MRSVAKTYQEGVYYEWHLVDKVFDPALNIQHTEDIIINHLDAAENQYKQKLKEINLGEITNYVHQNSI